jgi:hypothetical protein
MKLDKSDNNRITRGLSAHVQIDEITILKADHAHAGKGVKSKYVRAYCVKPGYKISVEIRGQGG